MLQYIHNNTTTTTTTSNNNYSINNNNDSIVKSKVISNNPEAILAFTCLTISNLLYCSFNDNHKYPLPPLNEFIKDLYSKKNIITSEVKLFSLIYLLRLKSKLPHNSKGGPDTPYRLFLASILIASKYLCENGTGLTSTKLSNLIHAAYSPKEINRMEKCFLGLIRYDLWVSQNDIQSFLKSYGDILQMNYYSSISLTNDDHSDNIISHPA